MSKTTTKKQNTSKIKIIDNGSMPKFFGKDIRIDTEINQDVGKKGSSIEKIVTFVQVISSA